MSVSAPRLSGAFAGSVFSVFSCGVAAPVVAPVAAGFGVGLGGAPPLLFYFCFALSEFFFEDASSLDFFFFFASAMFLASRITLYI